MQVLLAGVVPEHFGVGVFRSYISGLGEAPVAKGCTPDTPTTRRVWNGLGLFVRLGIVDGQAVLARGSSRQPSGIAKLQG